MILSYIKKIIEEQKSIGASPLYIRSMIKEYLQIIILDYVYTTNEFKSNLIFTGGTCLRHLYGIPSGVLQATKLASSLSLVV